MTPRKVALHAVVMGLAITLLGGAAAQDQPDRQQVAVAMKQLQSVVQACERDREGVAMVRTTVLGATGAVSEVSVEGEFAGTPEATCIVEHVKQLRLSPFAAASFSFVHCYKLHVASRPVDLPALTAKFQAAQARRLALEHHLVAQRDQVRLRASARLMSKAQKQCAQTGEASSAICSYVALTPEERVRCARSCAEAVESEMDDAERRVLDACVARAKESQPHACNHETAGERTQAFLEAWRATRPTFFATCSDTCKESARAELSRVRPGSPWRLTRR